MSLVHVDAAEHYSTSEYNYVYTDAPLGAGVTIGAFGPASGPGIRLSGNRGFGIERLGLTTSGNVCIIEGYFRMDALPAAVNNILNVYLGATLQVALAVNTDGTLRVYRNGIAGTLLVSSTYAVPVDTFIYLAAKFTIHNSTGAALIHVWETGDTAPQVVINLTGADTQEGASATWDGFDIGAANDTDTDWANPIVMDGSGTRCNDILGPSVDVITQYADARLVAILNDFSLSAGSSVPALLDDTTPDNDTTYVSSSTAGHRQSTYVDALPAEKNAIGMQLYVAAKSVSGSPQIRGLVRHGTTNYLGVSETLTTGYGYVMVPYSAMPDGSVPVPALFDALQWGAQIVAPAGGVRVTQVVVVTIVNRSDGTCRNLLTGLTHTVESDAEPSVDNVIAGESGHLVDCQRVVLLSLDGDAHTVTDEEGKLIVYGDVEIHGTLTETSGSPGGSPGPIGINLDDLDDVTVPSPSAGDVLTFDSGSGEWVASNPSVIGVAQHIVATADETVTSNTSPQNDDELNVPVDANSVYIAEWLLNFTSGTAVNVDANITFTVPSGATITWSLSGYQTTATSLDAQQRHATRYQSLSSVNHGVISTATIDASPCWITAIIRTAGTAGTVTLQWAQAASSLTGLVRKADSFVRYTKTS